MAQLKLDAIDLRILGAVQEHGPLSKTALAEIVHLSPTPCWTRLKRLEKAGVVRGYHADIALDRVADFTKVLVTVALTTHRRQDFERFEKRIQEIEEIVECLSTGGGYDYVLKFVTPSLRAFQSLMEQLLAEDIGIDRYIIHIVTREIKSTWPNLSKTGLKSGA